MRKFNPKARTVLMSAYEVDNDSVFRGYVKQDVIDKFIQEPISVRNLYEQVNYQLVSYHTKLRNK